MIECAGHWNVLHSCHFENLTRVHIARFVGNHEQSIDGLRSYQQGQAIQHVANQEQGGARAT